MFCCDSWLSKKRLLGCNNNKRAIETANNLSKKYTHSPLLYHGYNKLLASNWQSLVTIKWKVTVATVKGSTHNVDNMHHKIHVIIPLETFQNKCNKNSPMKNPHMSHDGKHNGLSGGKKAEGHFLLVFFGFARSINTVITALSAHLSGRFMYAERHTHTHTK